MNRRDVLATTAVAMLMGTAAFAGSRMVDFDDSDPIATALADGKTVLVDYAANWCSTCARQERVINALRDSNPAYDANIVFVRVDWDDYGTAPVSVERNIPRRSTLIVLKGDLELGRIVAGTQKREIQALMDLALEAALASG